MIKTVCISKRDGNGYLEGTQLVNVNWVCPQCGQPRGKIEKGRVIEETQNYTVDTWVNPCGHCDRYTNMQDEAVCNGLNKELELSPFKAYLTECAPEGLSVAYDTIRYDVPHAVYLRNDGRRKTKGFRYMYNKDGLVLNGLSYYLYDTRVLSIEILDNLGSSYFKPGKHRVIKGYANIKGTKWSIEDLRQVSGLFFKEVYK